MFELLLVVKGRQIFQHDLPLIQSTVAAHSHEGVRGIAAALCQQWSWQRRGKLYVDGAERILTALAYRGLVSLPGLQRQAGMASRGSEDLYGLEAIEPSLQGHLSDFPQVQLRLAETCEMERVFDGLMARYHYLGSRRVIGEHLKYLAFIGLTPVVALLWGRAALKIGARDRFIGWTPSECRLGIHRIANNYRFLVLPWVRIRYLASHVLAKTMRVISDDWEERFGHGLDYLETFVDPERFHGTCYLATNWVSLGHTRGSGRRGPHYHYHGHPKLVLLYPLRDQRPGPSVQDENQSVLPSLPLTVLPEPCLCEEGEVLVPMERTLSGGTSFSGQLGVDQMRELVKDLSSYCSYFHDIFPRSESRKHFDTTIGSLMSPLEKKNSEHMALYGGSDTPVRTWQTFVGNPLWSDSEARIRHQFLVSQTLGSPEGVVIIDGCGFPKKGEDSAGVARQYCGATGKIDNCQMGVFMAYANSDGRATLVEERLYLPQSWFEGEGETAKPKRRRKKPRKSNSERWKNCHIPPDTVFATKPQLALDMIREVHASGRLPMHYILADEEYGQNHAFLDGIPEGLIFFCEVPKNTRVWALQEIQDGKISSSVHAPVTVELLCEGQGLEWCKNVSIKPGAHGPIVADVARQRVMQARKKGDEYIHGTESWVFLRCNPETGEKKYYITDLPVDAPMEKMVWLCGMRWPVETCFQEGKDYLGMDHYQGRSWTAWHHHMTLIFLAHHFLTYQRLSEKKTSFRAAVP